MVIEVKMIEIKNAQGGEGVTNNPVSCEERIDAELERVLQTFRKAMESADREGQVIMNDDEVYEDIYEWLNSYALAYEDDPHYRAKKLLLSTGGPEDFFLFFEEEDIIEYHYLDWYDEAYRALYSEDYELMKRFYEEVLNI